MSEVDIDKFIQITFVLLILSMITEKIAQFVKLRFPKAKLKSWLVKDRSYKYAESFEELKEYKKDLKAREIQTLTLLIGFTLAYGCRANIFEIYDPEYQLTWAGVKSYSFKLALYDIAGCSLTGVFLSFGSKFFHDLLGILMETKFLKRKLNSRDQVTEMQTVAQVDTYIKELEPVIIESKLKTEVEKIPNLISYEYSDIDKTVDVFLPPMEDHEIAALDRSIKVFLDKDNYREIEVNYIGL